MLQQIHNGPHFISIKCYKKSWRNLRILWSFPMMPPSSARFQTMMTLHIARKLTVLQSGAQRTNYCSVSAKSRSWLLTLGKRRQRHTALFMSVELRWSRWTVLGSWESASQRTCHLTSPPWWKAQKRRYLLRKLEKAKGMFFTEEQ